MNGTRSAGSLTIRRADPDDLPEVARLFRLVSERDYDLPTVERLVCGLDPQRYYVWLALTGGQAVGMTMMEPRTLQRDGQVLRAGYWTNLFVDPAYRTSTLYPRLPFAMFKGASEAGMDLVYAAVRRPRVAEAHLAIGMRQIARLPVLAKPIRPASLIAKHNNWGAWAKRLSRLPDAAYAGYLAVRRSPVSEDYSIEELPWDAAEVRRLVEIAGASASPRLRQLWSAELFRERFAYNSDGAPYTLVGAFRRRDLVAGAVYRMARRGKNICAGIVMEAVYEDGEEQAVQGALAEIERRAHAAGADVVLCLPGWDERSPEIFRGLGYMTSPESYVLMRRSTAEATRDLPLDDASAWRFGFADHDAF